MSRVLAPARAVDGASSYDWARAAAQAAALVPATGRQAADWTVRGWAEVALGCAILGSPAAFHGLDDAVRASPVRCGGQFASRLRALRGHGGDLPACYAGGSRASDSAPAMLTPRTAQACMILAEFCDALSAATAAAGPGPSVREQAPPPSAGTADHLRWGEPLRPRACGYVCQVQRATVPQSLAWRSWMCLPGAAGRQITLVDLGAGRPSASARQRVCHGIHNGAHLDHLGALAAADPAQTWAHAPVEFGAGLLTAESFAMAVEILAAAQCVLAGLPAETRELLRGLVERIGRIPGYRAWHAKRAQHCGSAALAGAATVSVPEFTALPALAANYVTGPLCIIGSGAGDPLLPAALHALYRRRWAAAAARFPPAALLAERAAGLA